MQETEGARWVWERTDVRHSGSSGDIAKLFKNERLAHPGVMAVGAPSDEATLAAREVIQNSWDAARELQAEIRNEGGESQPFEIDFVFSSRSGNRKSALTSALDLLGISEQIKRIDSIGPRSRASVGLGPSNCLDSLLKNEIPLTSMVIIERGASGMYGRFDQAQSKLYLALISIGYTKKAEGSGGSYGYGKAGLVAASSTRTVVAYTCFRERSDDPGVTRRLIGMTYWGQHEIEGTSFTGFARFGRFEEGWSQPFENEAADDVARSLGLSTRDPAVLSDLGTTFFLLEPLIDPDDLRIAIERNWWPAITDNAFTPRVHREDEDGNVEHFEVRPTRDPVIKTFVRGYELATVSQDNALSHELAKDLGRAPKAAGALPLGRVGLLAKLDGWSYAELLQAPGEASKQIGEEGTSLIPDESSIRPSSLVALVRGPRMVVEYLEYAPGKAPYVRGTFVADEAVDELLRQTEPKAHNSWKSRGLEEGVDERAPQVAEATIRKIKLLIAEFQKRLKPPPPAIGDVRLPIFAGLFERLVEGKDISVPAVSKARRDVSVVFPREKLKPIGEDSVSYEATIRFRLAEAFKKFDHAEVEITFDYHLLEDGRRGRSCRLEVKAPEGFSKIDEGRFTGVLTKKSVTFLVRTEPYSADWTGRITAIGRLKSRQGGGADVA